MSNLRRFIMLFVVFGQLLWPIQSYAFIPAVLGLVEMAGAAMEGVSVGAVITGAAITIGGSAASTCATCTNKQPTSVAFGPAGMAVPPGWGRGSDGTPKPPASTPPSGSGDPNAPGPGSPSIDVARWYANNRPDMICGSGASSAYAISDRLFQCYVGQGTFQKSWTPPASPACPDGYVMNGSSCSIGPAGPDSVPKPPGTDCQAYFKAGKFSFDNLNPACLSPDGTVTGPDGTKVSIANGTISVLPTGYSQPVATIIPTTTGGAVVSVLGSGADGKAQTNSTVIDYVTGTPTVTGQVTSAGNNIANPPVAGVGSGGAPIKITCQDIGTCGVSQEATQQNVLTNVKSIAGALARWPMVRLSLSSRRTITRLRLARLINCCRSRATIRASSRLRCPSWVSLRLVVSALYSALSHYSIAHSLWSLSRRAFAHRISRLRIIWRGAWFYSWAGVRSNPWPATKPI